MATEPAAAPLQPLASEPVLGVDLGGVRVLRLDLLGGPAPGNKTFKLRASLEHAGFAGGPVLSFGGAWSNHLHALAALGAREGFPTIGVIRGEEPARPGAALRDMRGWGMRLQFVSREQYRRRGDPRWQEQLRTRFGAELVLPEGGAGSAGVSGCRPIGRQLRRDDGESATVVLAVGTGATLAGTALGLGPEGEVLGISALRGAQDLEERISGFIGGAPAARWSLSHDDHCGGFARVSADLKAFMLEFERVHGILLDPVYTAKAMYAVFRRVARGERRRFIVIHTGGLQGRRGYDWLRCRAAASPQG